MERIINIRDYPEWLERAADYFSSKWGIDRQLYIDGMTDSLTTEAATPRWYLMLKGETILGAYGLIDDDFMVGKEFRPWLCGLYVEPGERGRALGARLLAHGRREAAALGFDKIFLNTDHIGYYEKYGWIYTGSFPHQEGVDARVYEAGTQRIETSRLVLRPFVEADAAAASYNSRQPSARESLSDMVWETEEDAREWIEWFNAEKYNIRTPHVALAIVLKENNRLIGFVGVGPKAELNGEIEIGWLIAEEYQNNGYATEAAKAIIWWAFETAGQEVLSAITARGNSASRRVLEKLGFVGGGVRIFDGEPDAGGMGREYLYYRLFFIDALPGPEWDARFLYKPEPMGEFFEARADGYNEHMFSGGGGDVSYKKLGGFFPKTSEPLNILDLGCGTGIELDYIWAQAPNSHITCLDLSRGMLDLLMRDHPDSHDRITVVEASYTGWAYPENEYDAVVSSVTMHHLWPEEKSGVYGNILKALKPGGWYIEDDFIVDELQAEQYKRRYELITANIPRDKPNNISAGEYHIDIPCTLDAQRELLLGAGFVSVEVLDANIQVSGSGAILKAYK